jgi:hypothetical protein
MNNNNNNPYYFPFEQVNHLELIPGHDYYIKLNDKVIHNFLDKMRTLPVSHFKGTFVRLHTEIDKISNSDYAVFKNVIIMNKKYKRGLCNQMLVRYPEGFLAVSGDCNDFSDNNQDPSLRRTINENREVFFNIKKWIFGIPTEHKLLVEKITKDITPKLNEDMIREISAFRGSKLKGGEKKRNKKTFKKKNKRKQSRKMRIGGDPNNIAISHLNFEKLTNELTPSLYRGKMSQNDNERLIKISDQFLKSEPNKLKSKEIYCDKIGNDEGLMFIKNYAYEILSSLDFYVNPSECMIEFWSYNTNGGRVTTTLDFHEDDYGVLNDRVDTVIFYTRKDDTLQGGNLKIEEKVKQYKILFGLGKFHNIQQKIIEIKANDIVVFNGNLVHQPEDVTGNGQRDCIVVQFKSKRECLKYF